MSDHEKLREAIKEMREMGTVRQVVASSVSREAKTVWADKLDIVLAAAYSTLPRTKMVEVWRVEWAHPLPDPESDRIESDQIRRWKPYAAQYSTEADARLKAHSVNGYGNMCIRVTGPHQQEVPE